MDGNAPSYSDIDENKLTPVDSGRVRSIPEAPPLSGSWRAPTSAERPIRELGALNLKPIETPTGYYLKNTVGSIQTDNSTLAISFRPLNGAGGGAQGGISGPIGTSAQSLGISFVGNAVGLYFNHTAYPLKKRLSRGAHVTIIVRFTSTGVTVEYDIDGLRASESITATIEHETASNFLIGYDSKNNADIYGYVSQVVGVNRAVSDEESSRLMMWLTSQPIPAAFPVSKPLVAVLGDSIANGDQVAGWQSWPFRILADLSDTNPDVQLLNAATNGSGIPKVKNSDYSDFVLPWYSAARAKNILLVAAGTNDLANANNLSDLLDRYYSLLDSARATGWKTVACTILPRSNPGMVAGVQGFEAARSTFNADLVANWASHADALADVAAINGMGAAGDSDNTTYYAADKVHPTAAGHALLAPVYQAAITSQL
jgi:lysophospholipase L1-like esterase